MKNLRLFLPDIAFYQLDNLGLFQRNQAIVKVSQLQQDWQSIFCDFIGYQADDLPWTMLRLAQFELDSKVKTACCCDPVLMQMTHRGAYMMGQNSLNLTQNDAIRVVAQINEKLMDDGEDLYLIDRHAWLYTSQTEKSLSSLAVKDLVGKDMFNYPYLGDDANYWQRLGNEIQMLIKQMIDYQGLDSPPPELMMSVHFSDLIKPYLKNEIPFTKNDSLNVVSNNELIKSFCMNSFISHSEISALQQVANMDIAIIAFDSERDCYPQLIEYWLSESCNYQLDSTSIICQDSVIELKPKPGFWQSLFSRNK